MVRVRYNDCVRYELLHSEYCMEWPDIDRGGIYKDTIEELNNDLLWAMIITRNLLFGE